MLSHGKWPEEGGPHQPLTLTPAHEASEKTSRTYHLRMVVVNEAGVVSDISQVLSSLQVRLEYLCFLPVAGNPAHSEVQVRACCDRHTWDLVQRKLMRLIRVIAMGEEESNFLTRDK
jgi:acetolactate synthase small subunit